MSIDSYRKTYAAKVNKEPEPDIQYQEPASSSAIEKYRAAYAEKNPQYNSQAARSFNNFQFGLNNYIKNFNRFATGAQNYTTNYGKNNPTQNYEASKGLSSSGYNVGKQGDTLLKNLENNKDSFIKSGLMTADEYAKIYKEIQDTSAASKESGPSFYVSQLRGYGVNPMSSKGVSNFEQALSDVNTAFAGTNGAITSTRYGLGNIDLTNRPRIQNEDGTYSTVDSTSWEVDGKHVLMPTVIQENGEWKHVTPEEALQHYYDTGEYLGIFDTSEEADAYGKQLHLDQETTLKMFLIRKRHITKQSPRQII